MKKIFFAALLTGALFLSPAAADGNVLQGQNAARADANGGVFAGLLFKAKKAPPLATNIYCWANCYAPKNFEGDIALDSSFATGYGAKISYGALEGRYFNSCPKTGGADFLDVDSFDGYEAIFKNRRWSLSLDLSKFSDLVAGTVAFGSLKFYSQKRLAPFSVVVSPFAARVGDAGFLKVSLPSKSSSARDDAIFAAVSFKIAEKFSTETIRFMPLRAEFGIVKNKADPQKAPFILGLGGGFFYMNFFKLTAGLLFRKMYYSEEKNLEGFDWFDDVPVWKSELKGAASFDLAIEIPHLKSRTTFCVVQSPSSLGRWTAAQEFFAEAGAFCVCASFYASDNIFESEKKPYVAANSAEGKKNWQAKITPQLSVKLKNGGRLKVGAGGLLEERIVDYSKKSGHNSLEARFSAGIQISGKRNSFRLCGTSGAAVLRQSPAQETVTPLPKAGATATFSHNFAGERGGRLSVSCGASFQPEFYWEKREWTERLKAAYYPRKSFVAAVWAAFEASQKNGTAKFTPSAAASFLVKMRNVRLNASVSAAFPLAF